MACHKLFSGILIILLCVSCSFKIKKNSPKKTEISGYDLIWADEFDVAGKPNPKKWSFEQGFVRNKELQWYQEENATVANGILTIQAKKAHVKNPFYQKESENWRFYRPHATYTSSSINTRNKFSFQYGIVEVKAKIDTVSGLWPAIWTLGIKKPWPANGEIDIMEFYRINKQPHILANAAWKGTHNVRWNSEQISFHSFIKKDMNWADKYHIWKMDWTPNYIKIYLDNELLNEINTDKIQNPDGFKPFHQPHYILLNLAIGSNGGNPSETVFPKDYKIDYVRVYQKK